MLVQIYRAPSQTLEARFKRLGHILRSRKGAGWELGGEQDIFAGGQFSHTTLRSATTIKFRCVKEIYSGFHARLECTLLFLRPVRAAIGECGRSPAGQPRRVAPRHRSNSEPR